MISPEAMERMKTKMKERVRTTPPKTWGKVGAGVLVGGVVIGWLAFPYVLDKVVAMQINLSEGKDSRRLWLELPPFDCNIYVFNITNPAAVMRGAKPEVQEVGPFCYKEVKDKTDLTEDPLTDTISYSARTTWYPNQRGSNCLTGDEILVVPNIPMLAVLLSAEKDFPSPFMTLVNQALPNIFGKFDDLFIRVNAKTLLFGGVPVNCSANALYPRAVCIALKQNSRALKKLGNNQYTFSFFGAKNNTAEEFRLTVKRGSEVGQEIGRLVEIDGKPELPFWRGECNKLQGTDSSVFPPFRQKVNGSLAAYSSEYCRVFLGTYVGVQYYKGVEGYEYTISLGDTETNLGDRCYCPGDDRCRKKGVLDALKCQGAPLVASLPHFYQASPDYINGVVGLRPDKEKHEISIVLEPISGTPLVVRKKIQFNIDFKPIRYVPLTQRLQRTLLPLFWAEERLDLDVELMGLLESSLFRPMRAVDVIKWMCVVLGLGLGVTAAVVKYRNNRRDKVHVLNGGPAHEDTEIKNGIDRDIKTETEQIKNGKYNDLSASALMMTASTMTSANGLRPVSQNKLLTNIQQLPENNTVSRPDFEYSHPFVPQEDYTENIADTPPSRSDSTMFDLPNYNKIVTNEAEKDFQASKIEMSSSPTKTVQMESTSSTPRANSPRGLDVTTSLSKEGIQPYQQINELSPYAETETETTKLHINPDSSTNNTLAPLGEGHSTQQLHEFQLFGNKTSSTDGEKENTSHNEEKEFDNQMENATDEEVKAVEEDIRKLMAEMAAFIPKKLYNRDEL